MPKIDTVVTPHQSLASLNNKWYCYHDNQGVYLTQAVENTRVLHDVIAIVCYNVDEEYRPHGRVSKSKPRNTILFEGKGF